MTRTSKRHPLLMALASLALLSTGASSASLTSSEICSSAEFQALPPTALGSGPVTIKSLIKDDQVCLEFALTASVASSAAWFAVGLSTSDTMVSSPTKKNVKLFLKSLGQPESYVLGGYTRSQVTKESDQSAFVVGSASTSAMSFSYQRTLAAASRTEVAIAQGAQANFIWAYDTMWPISAHGDDTMGTATYTFSSVAAGSTSTTSSTTTTTAPAMTTTSSKQSKPFCDGKNCTAIVGGIAFLVMVLAGLLATVVLQKSPIGRALLHRTLAAPPLKTTACISISLFSQALLLLS